MGKKFWVIGGDGSGGIYFINSMYSDKIFYIDHDDAPSDFNDEKLKSTSWELMKRKSLEGWNGMVNERETLENKIKDRKWFQFWVPKKLPVYYHEFKNRVDLQ